MRREKNKNIRNILKLPLTIFVLTICFMFMMHPEEAHAHEGYIKNKTFKISNLGKDAKSQFD